MSTLYSQYHAHYYDTYGIVGPASITYSFTFSPILQEMIIIRLTTSGYLFDITIQTWYTLMNPIMLISPLGLSTKVGYLLHPSLQEALIIGRLLVAASTITSHTFITTCLVISPMLHSSIDGLHRPSLQEALIIGRLRGLTTLLHTLIAIGMATSTVTSSTMTLPMVDLLFHPSQPQEFDFFQTLSNTS